MEHMNKKDFFKARSQQQEGGDTISEETKESEQNIVKTVEMSEEEKKVFAELISEREQAMKAIDKEFISLPKPGDKDYSQNPEERMQILKTLLGKVENVKFSDIYEEYLGNGYDKESEEFKNYANIKDIKDRLSEELRKMIEKEKSTQSETGFLDEVEKFNKEAIEFSKKIDEKSVEEITKHIESLEELSGRPEFNEIHDDWKELFEKRKDGLLKKLEEKIKNTEANGPEVSPLGNIIEEYRKKKEENLVGIMELQTKSDEAIKKIEELNQQKELTPEERKRLNELYLTKERLAGFNVSSGMEKELNTTLLSREKRGAMNLEESMAVLNIIRGLEKGLEISRASFTKEIKEASEGTKKAVDTLTKAETSEIIAAETPAIVEKSKLVTGEETAKVLNNDGEGEPLNEESADPYEKLEFKKVRVERAELKALLEEDLNNETANQTFIIIAEEIGKSIKEDEIKSRTKEKTNIAVEMNDGKKLIIDLMNVDKKYKEEIKKEKGSKFRQWISGDTFEIRAGIQEEESKIETPTETATEEEITTAPEEDRNSKDIANQNTMTNPNSEYSFKRIEVPVGKFNGEIPKKESGNIDETPEKTNIPEKKSAEEIESFITAHGSIYTYNSDGKTTRLKTETGEQMEAQDITVFVDLSPDEEQDYLQAYRNKNSPDDKIYIVERQKDNSTKIIRDISQIKNAEEIYLIIANKGEILQTKKASLKPIKGWNVFDTRHYTKNNKEYTERHLGNKVVDIKEKLENLEKIAEKLKFPEEKLFELGKQIISGIELRQPQDPRYSDFIEIIKKEGHKIRSGNFKIFADRYIENIETADKSFHEITGLTYADFTVGDVLDIIKAISHKEEEK